MGLIPQMRSLKQEQRQSTRLMSKSDDNSNYNNYNYMGDSDDSDLFSALSSSSSTSSSFPDSPDDMMDEIQRSKQRMDVVRQLQKTFYKTASSSRMDAVVNVVKEECENNDHDADECLLMDTDSVAAIVTETELDQTIDHSYQTPTKCHYEESTGKLLNVPLWRTNWIEIPYRTNLVTVNEAMYTNMFEEMIRSHPKPWYVGHLHLPGGSDSLRKVRHNTQDSYNYELHSWHDEESVDNHQHRLNDFLDTNYKANDNYRSAYDNSKNPQSSHDEADDDSHHSAALGTLLRITDYRRLDDGKIVLFVQSLYRFVVDEVIQTFPYGIANIQIVPDYEELLNVEEMADDFILPFQDSETICKQLRVQSIKESFHCWQEYEFEETLLPMKLGNNNNDGELTNSEMEEVMGNLDGNTINKLLPFSNFHITSNDVADTERVLLNALLEETKTKIEFVNLAISTNMELLASTNSKHFMLPCLELQLLKRGILKEPLLLQRDTLMNEMSLKQLEIRFWYALNDYAKTSSKPIPLSVLELLPYHVNWPSNFVILNIVSTMEKIQSLQQQQKLRSSSDDDNNHHRRRHLHNVEDHRIPPRAFRTRMITNNVRTKLSLSSSSSSSTESDSESYYSNNRHIKRQGINNQQQQYKPCYHRVSEQYPNIRRVQRLSYHAGQLLEDCYDTNISNNDRQSQNNNHRSEDDDRHRHDDNINNNNSYDRHNQNNNNDRNSQQNNNNDRHNHQDSSYLKQKRQQRLMNVNTLRQQLLQISSIHGRLAFVTQQLEFRNMNHLHAFD